MLSLRKLGRDLFSRVQSFVTCFRPVPPPNRCRTPFPKCSYFCQLSLCRLRRKMVSIGYDTINFFYCSQASIYVSLEWSSDMGTQCHRALIFSCVSPGLHSLLQIQSQSAHTRRTLSAFLGPLSLIFSWSGTLSLP